MFWWARVTTRCQQALNNCHHTGWCLNYYHLRYLHHNSLVRTTCVSIHQKLRVCTSVHRGSRLPCVLQCCTTNHNVTTALCSWTASHFAQFLAVWDMILVQYGHISRRFSVSYQRSWFILMLYTFGQIDRLPSTAARRILHFFALVNVRKIRYSHMEFHEKWTW